MRRFAFAVVCLAVSSPSFALTMEYKIGDSVATAPEAACSAHFSWWDYGTELTADDDGLPSRCRRVRDGDVFGSTGIEGLDCDGEFTASRSDWATQDPDCKDDTEQEVDCSVLDSSDNFWGAPLDDWRSGPDYVTSGGCEYAINRFHTLVDGSVLPEYTPTGREMDGPDDAGPEGTAPTTDGNGNTTRNTAEGNPMIQEDPANNGGDQCGTMNGERVCVSSTPSRGGCIDDGSSFTCSAPGDDPIVPETPDGERADITDQDQLVEVNETTNHSNVTISQGTITEGDYGLDESRPPSSVDGGDDSGAGGDGDGDGEFDIPSVCEDDPIICEAAETITDDSVPADAQAEADGPLPSGAVEEIGLPGGPVYEDSGLGPGGACPEPETFDLSFVGAGTKHISYQPFCDFAAMIRPLVLAVFAGLSALLAFRKLA